MPQPPPQLQPEPPQPPEYARTDLSELKSQLVKRLGQERAQRYFSDLNRLLSRKLSKAQFIKLCVSTIGSENLPLHNQLICSILRNACQAKTPSLLNQINGTSSYRPSDLVLKKPTQPEDGFNSFKSSSGLPILSNGEMLPPSPRKFRSAIQNWRIKDRPSPLGPNGRAEDTLNHALLPYDEPVVRENGILGLCDIKRPLQHQQGGCAEKLQKRQRMDKLLPRHQGSVHREDLAEAVAMNRDDAENHLTDFEPSRGPIEAPLSISFGGARKSMLLAARKSNISRINGIYDNSELCDSESLKKRMDNIAESQGLIGVTVDCANLLNNGMDAYLKRLIRSSVELVRSRTGQEPIRQQISKPQRHVKPVNGVWMENHIQAQSNDMPPEGTQGCSITMQDFKVAMELKPEQLGEEWPLLLEKICFRSFEE